MAKQNRTTLKEYFQTGKSPSQNQYKDFIDSKILYPNIELCTDNAAMIAFLGEIYLKKKLHRCESYQVIPNLRLS